MQSFFFHPQNLINKYGTFHYFAVEYGWLKKMYTFKKINSTRQIRKLHVNSHVQDMGKKTTYKTS